MQWGLLPIVDRLLAIVYRLLATVYCLLAIVYRLLAIVYRLPLATGYRLPLTDLLLLPLTRLLTISACPLACCCLPLTRAAHRDLAPVQIDLAAACTDSGKLSRKFEYPP